MLDMGMGYLSNRDVSSRLCWAAFSHPGMVHDHLAGNCQEWHHPTFCSNVALWIILFITSVESADDERHSKWSSFFSPRVWKESPLVPTSSHRPAPDFAPYRWGLGYSASLWLRHLGRLLETLSTLFKKKDGKYCQRSIWNISNREDIKARCLR